VRLNPEHSFRGLLRVSRAGMVGAFASFAFLVIWAASTASNVGIAMFDTATGWFMSNMSRDPMVVALIQTATSLPLTISPMSSL